MIFKAKMDGKNESVYDPGSESFIAESVGGVFDVSDEVGKKMIELGYERIDAPAEIIPPVQIEMPVSIEAKEEPKRKLGRPRK